MEDFQPDCLYNNEKYKKLVDFYELGTGIYEGEKRLLAAVAHRTFMKNW